MTFRWKIHGSMTVVRMVSWIVFALSLAGCASSHFPVRPPPAQETVEQGWIDREVLERPEHQSFKTVYDTVHIRLPFIAMMKGMVGEVETIVFLGTWCSDSRREVPRFLKIVDALGIPGDRVRLFALDRSKKSPDGMTDRYNILRLPTMVFFKNGKEIGRIVETPAASVEEDMFTILAQGAVQ
jgi:thiol-disulfide isomerase/thioredoxin